MYNYKSPLPEFRWVFYGVLLYIFFGILNGILVFFISLAADLLREPFSRTEGILRVLPIGLILVLWEIAVGKLFREILPEEISLGSVFGFLIFAGIIVISIGLYLLSTPIVRMNSPFVQRIEKLRLGTTMMIPVILTLLGWGLYPLSNRVIVPSNTETETVSLPDNYHSSDRPNIIIVMLDTARWDRLSCYGYSKKTTPNIDRIAEKGLRFTKAIASSPYTSPSHASLFTGAYPSSHGVKGDNRFLVANNLTLAEVLQKAGYHTVGVVSNVNLLSLFGFDQGFDIYDDTPVWSRNILDYWYQWSLLGQFFYKFKSITFKPLMGIGQKIVEENSARVTNRRIFDALRVKHPKPLFLFVNYIDPHFPYLPPSDHRYAFSREYDGWLKHIDQQELCRLLMVQGKLVSEDTWNLPRYGPIKTRDWEYLSTQYDEEMVYLDQHVGELHTFLEQNEYLKNFILIILSDHGEHFGEHTLALHANSLYESLVHIPLIVVASGNVTPGERDQYVSLVDIPATVLSYAGIPVPNLLRGSDILRLEAESTPGHPVAELGDMRSLHAGPYKAIFEGERISLYNLETDPDELRDCAEENPEVVKEMKALLDRWQNSQNLIQGLREGFEIDRALKEQLRALGYVK
jgi:arylsulfatase A-like enzyme